ncbi:ABC transporter permease [Catenulispora sp. NF23]|uniref:ABC transporter permease n=1 Tax=Catenulispora pinistramenti TaxID=2705254 RepID=UPI001BA534BA|nr:ABC transporter permease [Catenulispora pinistramenti]MBS2532543.1 ABC transporter permease [Catenulispora pinistramenti]
MTESDPEYASGRDRVDRAARAEQADRASRSPRGSRPTVRLKPGDVLGLGLLGPRTRKLRAVLSSLGISIGIATVIMVVGIPASSQRALTEQLSALGTNLLTAQATVDQQTQTLPPVPASAPAMVARIPPVQRVSALGNTQAEVRRSQAIPAQESSGVIALAAQGYELPAVIGADLAAGRYLTPSDEAFPTVVLGSVAATWLGITTLPPGQPAPQIWIGSQAFTVVGVLAASPLAPEVQQAVVVGWDAARRYLAFDGHPTQIYARVQESQIDAVQSVLAATVYPQNPGQIVVSQPSAALAAKRLTETALSGLFLGLAGVALLVGAVGVANTMIVSVLERRREIGLRRALGATRRQIRGQFLTESVLLCLLGGLAGAAVGTLGTAGYAMSRDWPAVIPVASVLGGVGAALVVGVLAGVHPAVRASRLPPTEALATV